MRCTAVETNHLRVLHHSELAAAAEVGVTSGVCGVDALCLDGQLELRSRRILGVEVASAGELVERTPDLGDRGLPDNETDLLCTASTA
jgi:hypothetical protein